MAATEAMRRVRAGTRGRTLLPVFPLFAGSPMLQSYVVHLERRYLYTGRPGTYMVTRSGRPVQSSPTSHGPRGTGLRCSTLAPSTPCCPGPGSNHPLMTPCTRPPLQCYKTSLEVTFTVLRVSHLIQSPEHTRNLSPSLRR